MKSKFTLSEYFIVMWVHHVNLHCDIVMISSAKNLHRRAKLCLRGTPLSPMMSARVH